MSQIKCQHSGQHLQKYQIFKKKKQKQNLNQDPTHKTESISITRLKNIVLQANRKAEIVSAQRTFNFLILLSDLGFLQKERLDNNFYPKIISSVILC